MHLQRARAYARFIVSQQAEGGRFVARPPVDVRKEPLESPAPYAPGEAILALARWYAYDHNPLWLQAAARGARWLIEVRDAGRSERELANDHWLLMALSYLYAYRPEERYLQHALKVARAMKRKFDENAVTANDYPDYRGGYYDPPRATAAATRAEGLVAVLDLCAAADLRCAMVEQLLHDTVRHQLLTQYTPDQLWWPANPAKAMGGWSGGLLDGSIRNDFVQHNLSALLGTERQLAIGVGEELPGDPRSGTIKAAPTARQGVPAREMARLRAASIRYRGATHWERMAQKR